MSSSSYGRVWTGLVVATLVKTSDMAFLSALFRNFEREFNVSPTLLGYIWLAQSSSLRFAGVLWAPFVDESQDPTRFLVLAVAGVGFCSMLMSQASSFTVLLFLRFISGLCSSVLRPLMGSVVSKLDASSRGRYFGRVSISESIGRIFGAVVITHWNTSWRILVSSFGMLSMLVAAALYYFLPSRAELAKLNDGHIIDQPLKGADLQEDTTRRLERLELEATPEDTKGSSSNNDEIRQGKPMKTGNVKPGFADGIKEVFKMRSFQMIVLHGVFGTFPYAGFSFLVMWFQTGGVSNALAGVYGNSIQLGMIIGQFVAGIVGDYFATLSPSHGRIYMAQVAGFIRLPIVIFTFVGVSTSSLEYAAFGLFLLGLVIPWIATGATKPIIAELMPDGAGGRVMSAHHALQSTISIGSGIVVGALAEQVFGYDKAGVAAHAAACKIEETERLNLLESVRQPKDHSFVEHILNFTLGPRMSTALTVSIDGGCLDPENHTALGKAILWNTLVPWLISAMFLSFLHWTFPKDQMIAKRNKIKQA